MNLKGKLFLKSIIFILVISILISIASYILTDRTSTINGFYSEPENSKDVLIVGSSHVNNGVIPSIIWEEANMSAYNVYSWSQPMWISYHYIVEALKTQKPEVIVLEMFGMTYGNSHIMPQEIDKTSYSTNFSLKPSLNYLEMTFTVEKVGLELRKFEDFLNLPRYHSRWKEFDASMLTYRRNEQKDYLRGYGLTFNNEIQVKPTFSFDVQPYVPYEFCVEYLDKIVELCKEKDVDIVLTMTPYVYNEVEVGIFNWIEEYAKKNELDFLNFNTDKNCKEIGFDYATDLSDMGHLNYYGAVKVSKGLGEFLSKKYSNYHKEENIDYKNAQTDYEKFLRLEISRNIMTQSDVTTYLENVLNDNYIAIIASNNKHQEVNQNVIKTLTENDYRVDANQEFFIIDTSERKILTERSCQNSEIGKIDINTDENIEIFVNDQKVMGESDVFKIVVYDKVLEKLLEVAWLPSGGGTKLEHKEFTSDIISIYKKVN